MEITIDCPIWGQGYTATVYKKGIGNINDINEEDLVNSNRAGGAYRITLPAFFSVYHNNRLSVPEKARLTTWLVDQRRQGIAEPIVTDEIVESFEPTGGKRDLPVHERAERLLHFIAEKTRRVGARVDVRTSAYAAYACAWSESTNWDEVVFLLNYLSDKGWIDGAFIKGGSGNVMVTVDGYAQIADLSSNPDSVQAFVAIANPDSAQAFVAMWFNKDTDNAYNRGLEPAIKAAGFKPYRIDREPILNKIDDAIIEEIRRSRFLVADMTHGEDGARGSVYFEAGFAHGLKIPVIYTCRKDMFNQLHFDTRQYPHIGWSDSDIDSLRHELALRIRALIGDGPLRGTE